MKIALLVQKFSNFTGDARITEIQAEELIRGGNDVIVFALEADNKPINVAGLISHPQTSDKNSQPQS